MSAPVSQYVALITSEHNLQPKFTATVTATVQPFADDQAVLNGMPSLFDVDSAVGVQLDAIGLWANTSRNIDIYTLSDTDFRRILRAVILANRWDGTVEGAYAIWAQAFDGQDHSILIQDNGDMTMGLALVGAIPDGLTIALFTGAYIRTRPDGVLINSYAVPTVPDVPLFGFDIENSNISGFDVGAWARIL